ncbi:MAG TPA: hypothetical protein VMS31_10145, partial [Pyrinomonadaceae bacterium]|nr:hypothetical protein [Pyrinomonadaceae bacterium]
MTESQSQDDPKALVETARKAFEQEFERFAGFAAAESAQPSATLSLAEAETEQRLLGDLRTRHLGKKSALAAGKKLIGRVSSEERASFGKLVQQSEGEITAKIAAAEKVLGDLVEAARTERERIDVTLPGRRPRRGHLHPITMLIEKIEDIFVSLGYAIEDGREIETDFYNFDALNIPQNHPARATQDTFYTT